MDSITITRILLIITAFAFLFVFFRILLNVEDSDVMKNAWVLIAAIVPFLGVVVAIQNQYQYKQRYVYSIFYDTKEKEILSGFVSGNAYFLNYAPMFVNLSAQDIKIENPLELSKDAGLKFVEYGIVNSLSSIFIGSWDYEPMPTDLPGGGAIFGTGGSSEKSSISATEVGKIFYKNPLLNSEKFKTSSIGLCGPPNFRMNVEVGDAYRVITIGNRISKVKITITSSIGMTVQQESFPFFETGEFGIPDDRERSKIGRYWVQNYIVTVDGRINDFDPFISWSERKKYERWHNNIGRALEVFDWKKIAEENQKILDDKVKIKILFHDKS